MWIAGGKRIAFVYPDDKGNAQLWTMAADGSDRRQATDREGGIAGFLFSPDETKVVVIGNVKYARTPADVYPDLPKATGRIVDDLMYKHWDEWVTEIPPSLYRHLRRRQSERPPRHHGRRAIRGSDEAFRRLGIVCMEPRQQDAGVCVAQEKPAWNMP